MTNFKCLWIIVIVGFLSTFSGFAQDDLNCDIKPIEALELPLESGHLLFSVDGKIQSIDVEFLADQQMHFNGILSPNGEYLANRTRENNVNIVRVFSTSGELLYSGSPSEANIQGVYWLNNNKVLSFVLLNLGGGGGNTEYGVGYFVIEPFKQQYTYNEPSSDSAFYTQIPDSAFIEGIYALTYDGQYLFSPDRPIYNFETEQELNLVNYQWGIPSLKSHRLISTNHEVFRSEGFYPVYIYDFDTDTISSKAQFKPISEIIPYHENSWSSDESFWLYTLTYDSEDVDSFRRIEFVELDTGKIYSTCFGQRLIVEDRYDIPYIRGQYSPQFAWSRDGRYLALMTVIEGQSMDESYGLYLYDTQTAEIYLVHQGDADIIGWMANVED